MVLASEEACAVFQLSRSFKFNLSVCRQMHEGQSECAGTFYVIQRFKKLFELDRFIE